MGAYAGRCVILGFIESGQGHSITSLNASHVLFMEERSGGIKCSKCHNGGFYDAGFYIRM